MEVIAIGWEGSCFTGTAIHIHYLTQTQKIEMNRSVGSFFNYNGHMDLAITEKQMMRDQWHYLTFPDILKSCAMNTWKEI